MLVGRLTKDPELRYTSDGVPVANVTLAVSRPFKNAAGEVEADFVNCTLWRKTAVNTAEYCEKGSIIGLSGRIQTRQYVNSEGERTFITEVVARSVRFWEKAGKRMSRLMLKPKIPSINSFLKKNQSISPCLSPLWPVLNDRFLF